ncbi:hypothetical protein PVAP13_2KG128432 [Panicum virgatum]|uniref:Uncharacterized protein n=1 Tax=Panicum virgatum TaxID=38727 RepID=A0A8T0VV35_PANVG|nr:hypothetical protein PVAP13_2KG128432 [Panicum virgatum]
MEPHGASEGTAEEMGRASCRRLRRWGAPDMEKEMWRAGRRRCRRWGAPPSKVQEKMARRPAEAEEMGRGGRPNWRRRLRVSQLRRRRWVAPAAPFGGGDGCAKATSGGGDVVAAAVGEMGARRLWRGWRRGGCGEVRGDGRVRRLI